MELESADIELARENPNYAASLIRMRESLASDMEARAARTARWPHMAASVARRLAEVAALRAQCAQLRALSL
jgi:hypothetical protein